MKSRTIKFDGNIVDGVDTRPSNAMFALAEDNRIQIAGYPKSASQSLTTVTLINDFMREASSGEERVNFTLTLNECFNLTVYKRFSRLTASKGEAILTEGNADEILSSVNKFYNLTKESIEAIENPHAKSMAMLAILLGAPMPEDDINALLGPGMATVIRDAMNASD